MVVVTASKLYVVDYGTIKRFIYWMSSQRDARLTLHEVHLLWEGRVDVRNKLRNHLRVSM
jgi:hypothetical protein